MRIYWILLTLALLAASLAGCGGGSSSSSSPTATVLAVTSVSPDSAPSVPGGNTNGDVNVTITGSFPSSSYGYAASLCPAGQSAGVTAYNLTVVSQSKITCTLPVSGRSAGTYDIRVLELNSIGGSDYVTSPAVSGDQFTIK